MITVTDRAAAEVRRIVSELPPEDVTDKVFLRLTVHGGGCSGFQHKLDIDTQSNEKFDHTYEINGINVVIDKRSALYVEGAIVDYHTDLNKRGFSVTNPHAKTTCGCGSSFSM